MKTFVWISLASFWVVLSWGNEFPFEPPQHFRLNPKVIALHHPVKTDKILAQLYFDQGLTYLYAFNHDAAYWSFLRASQVDQEMPMAYWGMALALGTNINIPITPAQSKVAFEAVQKGLKLASEGAEKEYLHALAARYSNKENVDQNDLARQYSEAMRKLSTKYPDDLDAAVLYAESLLDLRPWNQWTLDGKPQPGTMEAVKKLESVLKRDPENLGANHYYIHAVEASSHPEIALMSAKRLTRLLPISGHILHMPSHIFLLIGDYQQSVRSNEAAIAADREYIREYGMKGIYPLHYLSHNIYFLARSYTMEGRFQEAKRAADELYQFYFPNYSRMPELEYYASAPLTVLMTFHHWKEILNLPKPPDEMKVNRLLWHFGRSLAYANLGDLTQALEEQKQFLADKSKLSLEQKLGDNPAEKIVAIADDCLKAKIFEAQGNLNESIHYLQKAVAKQDALRYDEPPDWFFPIRESLGGLLLKMDKPQEAELVFRQELNRHPRSGRALFGLSESLRGQSKTHDLYWVDKEFQEAWRNSPLTLTINDL